MFIFQINFINIHTSRAAYGQKSQKTGRSRREIRPLLSSGIKNREYIKKNFTYKALKYDLLLFFRRKLYVALGFFTV